jgi:ribulose-5-phosphate 4-epimerase/fuculose-1-phosphate aldolase
MTIPDIDAASGLATNGSRGSSRTASASDNPAATVADVQRLRVLLAQACRILAATGCVREITGHVSARIPGTQQILVRCRRPRDPGVEFTEARDIRRVSLDATNADLSDGYALPGEFAIHSEIYRARPDVGAVVHGHPESSLLCGVTDLPLQPLFGAYDPAALQLAVDGIPVLRKAVLISTPELGRELADTLADKSACLLRGHGVVTTGPDIKVATVNAIKLETLADITLRAHAVKADPSPISPEDVAGVSGFVDRAGAATTYASWTWDFYLRKVDQIQTPNHEG